MISVFIGPSLPPAQRPDLPGVRYLPPASAGDMLALLAVRPHTVLLVDGVFETARAPWHKEILVLLSSGFDVRGAASLGALRAAELAAFGMRGSGAIARAYRDGRIIGDDEVAVAHAPAALHHRPLSLAQVDVRATLVAATRRGIMPVAAARMVAAASRRIFFKQRQWRSVLAASSAVIDAATYATFAAWLPTGAVRQKQHDAQAAIVEAATAPPPGPAISPPPETSFLTRLRNEVSEARALDTLRKSASDLRGEKAETV